MLKPGGYLLLLETTRDTIITGVMLGALPSYWIGVDDGRVDSPFVSTSSWIELQASTGFSNEAVLSDYPEPYATTTTFISRALSVEPEKSSDEISAELDGNSSSKNGASADDQDTCSLVCSTPCAVPYSL